MPGPGYKRKGRSKNAVAAAFGTVGGSSKKLGKGTSKGSIASTLGAVGGSSKSLGKGLKHAAKERERHSTRAVKKYATGDKSFKPTLQQFYSAWPELPKATQDKLGPQIIARARSEISPEFGPKGDKARPRPLPKFLRKYDPKGFDAYNRRIPGATEVRESQAETDKAFNDDLGRAIETGLLVAPMGGILRAGKLGIDAIRAGKAAKATEEAATAGRAAKVAETAGEGTVKQATRVGKVADAAKATRAGRAAKATTEAAKESKVLRGTRAALDSKAGRVAIGTAKVGTAPIRKPITRGFPLYAGGSAAVAAVQGDDPIKAVGAAFTGAPTPVKSFLDRVGSKLDDYGVVGSAAKDLLELPAAVVPSTYMLGEATVKAIGGDSSELDSMWDSYVKSGALPAIAKGDFDQLLTALREHPVYSGLELYGAGAGASRATGAGLRAAPFERLRQAGSTERKPLRLADKQTEMRREYGKGTAKKSVQVALDRRRARRMGGQRANRRESERVLAGGRMKSGLADRAVGKGNLVVRAGRAEQMEAVQRMLPKGRGKVADANRNGVNLVVNYGVPRGDLIGGLQRLRTKALAERERLTETANNKSLSKDERSQAKMELRTNEEFIKNIENVIKYGDPETIFASAAEIGPRLRALQKDLVDAGVGLDKAQAEKATLIPAARLHLDAGYGKPVEQVAARKAYRQAKRRGGAPEGSRDNPVLLGTHRGGPRRNLDELPDDAYVWVFHSADSAVAQKFAKSGIKPEKDLYVSAYPNEAYGTGVGATGSRLATVAIRVRRGEIRGGNRELNDIYKGGIVRKRIAAGDVRVVTGKDLAKVLRREPGEKPPKPAAQVLDSQGRAYSTEQIRADLKRMGVDPDELGFVSMRPNAGGRGDFYQPWFPTEQGIASRARTGEAAVRGWAATADSLIGQMVRSRGIVDNARAFRSAIMEFAAKGPKGKVRIVKANRINAVTDELLQRTGMRWRAVRLNPRREGKTMEELTDVTPDDQSALMHSADLWQAAKQTKPEPGADYALIPDAVYTRFNQHFSHSGVFRQTMQMVNQAFKGTVLPYSPKWLLSNVADINLRSMIAGQPPIQRIFSLNRRFALNIVGRGKQIDPIAGRDAEALFEAGTHYGTQSTTRYFGRLENLADTSRLGQALLTIRRRPTIDAVVRLHQTTRDWVFNLNRNLVENPGQLAILGKQLRQEAIQKGYIRRWESVWKLDDAARNDLARGLLQTENQVRYAQGIERVFGQWGHNSPAMREFLVDYAPFGMWTRAATKFVFHTLPADHPVLTGIIAATELMTQDEREKLGLSVFAERPLPDNLRGALPLPGGGLIGGVAGMTSFGFFTDPGAAAAQTIIPQISGSLRALEGLDWTGRQLKHEDGTPLSQPELFAVALKEGAETFLPPLAVIQRASTLAGGDNPSDAARDLLLGKDLEPGIADWLRDREAYGTGEYTNSAPGSSSDSSSSSSSGSTLPPWYSGSSTSSSSGTGSSLPAWYNNP